MATEKECLRCFATLVDGELTDDTECNPDDPGGNPAADCALDGDEHAAKLLVKDTNPKDAVGIKKAPLSTVSAPVVAEVGVAMLEGGRKYGRHNYRVVGVRGSVYYDATLRHMMAWWEGEDLDPDSGLSHVTKAIASLVVLRDAMIHDKFTDDRPPRSPEGWLQDLNKVAAAVIEQHPNALPAYIEGDQHED